VYSIRENGTEISLEMAILIKEADSYRIFSMTPVNQEVLGMITSDDFNALEESFRDLLQAQ
jgi:hypothetical protein